MVYHGSLLSYNHGQPWLTMVDHVLLNGRPWLTMVLFTPRPTMVNHDPGPWLTMVDRGQRLWLTMVKDHGQRTENGKIQFKTQVACS